MTIYILVGNLPNQGSDILGVYDNPEDAAARSAYMRYYARQYPTLSIQEWSIYPGNAAVRGPMNTIRLDEEAR